MKRKSKEGKLFLGILVAVLILGVGYAAITGVNLLINGQATAKASAEDGDFIVHFDDFKANENYIVYSEEAGSDSFTQTFDTVKHITAASSTTDKSASITVNADRLSADVTVSNMTTVGDTVRLTIPVINESDGIKADLSTAITNNNSEYFNVTAETATNTLNSNSATTTITVTVEVVKVPKLNNAEGSFTVTLKADPTE